VEAITATAAPKTTAAINRTELAFVVLLFGLVPIGCSILPLVRAENAPIAEPHQIRCTLNDIPTELRCRGVPVSSAHGTLPPRAYAVACPVLAKADFASLAQPTHGNGRSQRFSRSHSQSQQSHSSLGEARLNPGRRSRIRVAADGAEPVIGRRLAPTCWLHPGYGGGRSRVSGSRLAFQK
jgi:hypothetical protein